MQDSGKHQAENAATNSARAAQYIVTILKAQEEKDSGFCCCCGNDLAGSRMQNGTQFDCSFCGTYQVKLAFCVKFPTPKNIQEFMSEYRLLKFLDCLSIFKISPNLIIIAGVNNIGAHCGTTR